MNTLQEQFDAQNADYQAARTECERLADLFVQCKAPYSMISNARYIMMAEEAGVERILEAIRKAR